MGLSYRGAVRVARVVLCSVAVVLAACARSETISAPEEIAWLGVVVTLMGHDATYGQTTHARHVYSPDNLKFDHHYVDVMGQLPDGRLVLDLTRFHETEPD